MALMESEELNNDLLPYDIGKTSPDILRDIFRTDAYQGTTGTVPYAAKQEVRHGY